MTPIFEPDQNLFRPLPPTVAGVVTPAMVHELVATHGWAILLSILYWVFAGLALLAGIGVLAVTITQTSPLFRMIAYCYLAVGTIFMVPALLLTRYAAALGRLRALKNEGPLIDALHHERRLWKFAALGGLIGAALFLLLVLIVAGRYAWRYFS